MSEIFRRGGLPGLLDADDLVLWCHYGRKKQYARSLWMEDNWSMSQILST